MNNEKYTEISIYQDDWYKDLIELLFKSCDIFKIVDYYEVFDVENSGLRDSLKNVRFAKNWGGPKNNRKAMIYTFSCDRNSKKFFLSKDKFFHKYDGPYVCALYNEQYDYSFIKTNDNNLLEDECILYMITHEGDLYLRNDYFAKLKESAYNY